MVRRVLVQLHARARRDAVPRDLPTPGRDLARLPLQRGRVHAEGLVEHGLQKRQLRQGRDGEGVGRRAGVADLTHEAGEVRRVREQQVQGAGQDAGRGLPARDDERGGVALDLRGGHALVVRLLEDVVHEVAAVGVAAQPAVDRLGRLAQQRVAALQHALGDARAQRAVRGRELHRHGHEDDELQRFEERGHPRVQVRRAQAVERFAEGEVADHVERVPAEPGGEVDGAVGGAGDLLTHAGDEVVDVRLQ